MVEGKSERRPPIGRRSERTTIHLVQRAGQFQCDFSTTTPGGSGSRQHGTYEKH